MLIFLHETSQLIIHISNNVQQDQINLIQRVDIRNLPKIINKFPDKTSFKVLGIDKKTNKLGFFDFRPIVPKRNKSKIFCNWMCIDRFSSAINMELDYEILNYNSNADMSFIYNRKEYDTFTNFIAFIATIEKDYYIKCKFNGIDKKFSFKQYFRHRSKIKYPSLYVKERKIDYKSLKKDCTEIIYKYLYNTDLDNITNLKYKAIIEKEYLNYFIFNDMIDIKKLLINNTLYVPYYIYYAFYLKYFNKYSIVSRIVNHDIYKEFDIKFAKIKILRNFRVKMVTAFLDIDETKFNIISILANSVFIRKEKIKYVK